MTGWILHSGSNRLVERNADGISTLSVAAVDAQPDGDRVSAPTDGATRLLQVRAPPRPARRAAGQQLQQRAGGFDPVAAHRLLDSDAAHRGRGRPARPVRRVRAGTASTSTSNGSARRDADGLVAFVRAIQDRMPEAKTVSIDVSATSSLRGLPRPRLPDAARWPRPRTRSR